MTKHITRGVLTGIPIAVLSAVLSNKGSRLRNALLYGGLTTAAATGASTLIDMYKQKGTQSNSLTKEEEQKTADISANMQRQNKDEIKSPVNGAKTVDDTLQNRTTVDKPEDQQSGKLFTAAQRLKELRSEEVKKGSHSALVNTWRGIFSKDDHGLKRTNPIQYTKFLGNLVGESFGKAWYSAAKAVDKALAVTEEAERKNQEALAVLKPGSIGFGLVPQTPRTATTINDITAAVLNPSNPEEYRQALRDGTARTQLYEQFIKDTGHNVDTIGKRDLGMSDGNLQAARIGSDMIINMTADPYTALSMGLTPVAKMLQSSAGLRTLADARRYHKLIKMRKAGIRPGAAPKRLKWTKDGVTRLGTEAGSELLEALTLPHYDIAKGGRVTDTINMFNRINERRAQLGKQPLDESYLELIYNNTSETPIVNIQNRLKLRMGGDYLGLIGK